MQTEIKNKLNLKFYKGSDIYSDGDIENDILKIAQENDDFSKVLKNDNRWAVLYHLTPLRRNLLEWYDFDKNADLLEIGAGCGAITGLLCEKVKSVTSVELSKRRAEIIANRTKDKDNLEIIVGNLNDIKFDKQFDYITLIGVFEYAGRFTDGENPYAEFLKNIKKLLKPDGTLVIAIENKFGLKYWSGANEDHTGKLFDSIEGYKNNTGVETFGKYELEQLLRSEGFENLDFYYPMPDYKIPTQIFTDEYTPNWGQMSNISIAYDQDKIEFFDEKAAYCNIIKNQQFGFFANSFLVFAKNHPTKEKKLYANFKREISPKFQIETTILKNETAQYSVKQPICKEAEEHIKQIYNNYLFLKDKFLQIKNYKITSAKLEDNKIFFEYAQGQNLQDLVQNTILKQNKKKLLEYFDFYINLINTIHNYEKADFNSNNSNSLKEIFGKIKIKNTKCIDYANIDLIFDNIIINNENTSIIDYEWVIKEKIPLNYIIARNIFNLYYKYNDLLSQLISQKELFDYCEIPPLEIKIYLEMEHNFQKYVYKDANYTILPQYFKRKITFDKNIFIQRPIKIKNLLKIKIGKFLLNFSKIKKEEI